MYKTEETDKQLKLTNWVKFSLPNEVNDEIQKKD